MSEMNLKSYFTLGVISLVGCHSWVTFNHGRTGEKKLTHFI